MNHDDKRSQHSRKAKTSLDATVSASQNDVPRRRRQTPLETRSAAIEAARKILIERGPQFVTLQSVAQVVGMSHSNIAHHFGSSGALRGALVDAMISPIMQVAPQLARKLRTGTVTEAQVVAAVFAAFGRGGLGALFAWMAAEGEISRFDTVFGAVSRTVQLVRKDEPAGVNYEERGSGIIIATLVASALGAALIGTALEDATGVSRGAIERQAARQLHMLMATTSRSPAPPPAPPRAPPRAVRKKPAKR